MISWRMLAGAAVLLGASAAQIADLSGTWHLNVAKSRWGKHPKPTEATITIEHHEPAFKYSGSIVFPNGAGGGEETQTFAFDGAIDGKAYPVTGTAGEGMLAFRRDNPTAIASELKSSDGRLLETAKTIALPDGTMIREIHAKRPDGDIFWTEVYERR